MPVVASVFTDIPRAIIDFYHGTLGFGWGPAIVLLTFTIRLAIMPLSIKQIKSMRAMQALQPQMKAIQEKYKEDKPRQQQAMMAFYKENEINPLASCLPLLLQMPVFFALYAMLRGDSFKADVMAHPPTGWLFIPDLLSPPVGIVLVVLIILFVGTQLGAGLAMSMRGQGLEGPQRFIVFGLPIMFAFFVPGFPSGLSVYWISTNVWTLGQQQFVHMLMGTPQKPTEAELEAIKAPPPPPPRKKKKKSGRQR